MPRPVRAPRERQEGARLGAFLRARREDGALSRNALARSAGLSPEMVYKVEAGVVPGVAFLLVARMAHALGFSLDDLNEHIARAEAGDTDGA